MKSTLGNLNLTVKLLCWEIEIHYEATVLGKLKSHCEATVWEIEIHCETTVLGN